MGRGAYVGTGCTLGNNVKLQNYALVYEPATLANGVFIGPAAVLTNDEFPRSVDPDGNLKRGADWTPVKVDVAEGASIGARAVCVAPVRIGRWSLVAGGGSRHARRARLRARCRRTGPSVGVGRPRGRAVG